MGEDLEPGGGEGQPPQPPPESAPPGPETTRKRDKVFALFTPGRTSFKPSPVEGGAGADGGERGSPSLEVPATPEEDQQQQGQVGKDTSRGLRRRILAGLSADAKTEFNKLEGEKSELKRRLEEADAAAKEKDARLLQLEANIQSFADQKTPAVVKADFALEDLSTDEEDSLPPDTKRKVSQWKTTALKLRAACEGGGGDPPAGDVREHHHIYMYLGWGMGGTRAVIIQRTPPESRQWSALNLCRPRCREGAGNSIFA